MADPARFSFVYIAEPPDYQILACTLLASIRTHFPAAVQAVGYCPAHKMDELHPAVLKAHEIMGAEIRPMRTEGMWATPYPHGNKILACREPRETDFAAFVDSDVLFLRPNDPANLARPGHVACSPAASRTWSGEEIWEPIYGAFGLPLPEERIRLMRRARRPVMPYFSAGLVAFPERGANGGAAFADTWYDTARRIDGIESLPHRRPYLDQMSLPVAIRRAGLAWHALPDAQHYILGGRIRGQPLPEGEEIFTIHYRHTGILRELGLLGTARAMLKRQTGVKYVRRLTEPAGG